MMAYLRGQQLPRVSTHPDYQNFTSRMNEQLVKGEGEAARLAERYGKEKVEHELKYNIHLSSMSLSKQLDLKEAYEQQDAGYGKALLGAELHSGWTLEGDVKNLDGRTFLGYRLEGNGNNEGTVLFKRKDDEVALVTEYRSTLPGLMPVNIKGKETKVPTMAYLSQKAIHNLVDDKQGITTFSVLDVEHLDTLAHMDWLQRNGLSEDIDDALPHTLWYQRIKAMISMAGWELKGKPEIIHSPEDSIEDNRWNALIEENIQRFLEVKTTKIFSDIDDDYIDWRDEALTALDDYKKRLSKSEVQELDDDLDRLALHPENTRNRYDVPTEGIQGIGFDVIWNVQPIQKSLKRKFSEI